MDVKSIMSGKELLAIPVNLIEIIIVSKTGDLVVLSPSF